MFITTSKNPYQYYLQTLKNSIKSMVGDDEELCNKILDKRIEVFERENTDIPNVRYAPNNPQRLLRFACYVSEYVFQDALATSITDSYGDPILTPAFGVEYYTYDFEGEFTTTKKPYMQNEITGYYITSRNKLWNNIKFQPNSANLLSKPNQFGDYAVINYENLSRRLKSDIRSYYHQNPDLNANKSPDPELQKIFGKVLGELSSSLMKSRNNRQGFNNYNF